MVRTLTVSALLAVPAIATSAFAAEEAVPAKHHLTAALGLGFAAFEPGSDAHWHQSGLGGGVRLAYAYRVSRAIELGAGATYFRVADAYGPDMLLPALSIRAGFPLGDAGMEIGVSGRAGLTYVRMFDITGSGINWMQSGDVVWSGGPSFAIAPDLHIPLAPRTALLLSLEFAVGGGKTDPDDATLVQGAVLREEAGFGQLVLWVGVVWGL